MKIITGVLHRKKCLNNKGQSDIFIAAAKMGGYASEFPLNY
jgi:hypothetical protein